MSNPPSPPSIPAPLDVDIAILTSRIGYGLRLAARAMARDFALGLASDDVRPAEFAVIEVLMGNPGLRQGQASDTLGIKSANFVPLLDRLQERGLVERRPIAGDRRARGLFLTDAGAAMVARWRAVAEAHEARFAGRIGPDGKAVLMGLLARLADPGFDL